MWKRDEAVKPTAPAGPGPAPAQPGSAPLAAETAPTRPATAGDLQRGQEKTAVNIGKSVVIKGELNGSEDLTIEGQVEGKIELRQNVLTIGANGRIKAQVFAKAVIILGEVTGNVTATEKVDIRDNGSVDGDIAARTSAAASTCRRAPRRRPTRNRRRPRHRLRRRLPAQRRARRRVARPALAAAPARRPDPTPPPV